MDRRIFLISGLGLVGIVLGSLKASPSDPPVNAASNAKIEEIKRALASGDIVEFGDPDPVLFQYQLDLRRAGFKGKFNNNSSVPLYNTDPERTPLEAAGYIKTSPEDNTRFFPRPIDPSYTTDTPETPIRVVDNIGSKPPIREISTSYDNFIAHYSCSNGQLPRFYRTNPNNIGFRRISKRDLNFYKENIWPRLSENVRRFLITTYDNPLEGEAILYEGLKISELEQIFKTQLPPELFAKVNFNRPLGHFARQFHAFNWINASGEDDSRRDAIDESATRAYGGQIKSLPGNPTPLIMTSYSDSLMIYQGLMIGQLKGNSK